MRIGIIGSGNIGGTLARLWGKAGHEVAISNSRGPESLAGLVSEIGPNARAETVEGAAQFGEAIVLAIPFGKYDVLPAAPMAGKIVMDAMNYAARRDGQMDMGGLTDTELVARHLPGARVVKAFNTIPARLLAEGGRPNLPVAEREVIYIAGDDADAKAVTARLIEELGFAPVDAGTLREGSPKLQLGTPAFTRPMTPDGARQMLRGNA
jgi:hypothetical protein